MTRFWITLGRGVEFVLQSLERMRGGEIFVPKIPSMTVTDVAKVVAPECKTEVIGIRPGEKLHEIMITPDDAGLTLEFGDHYVIQPADKWWDAKRYVAESGGKPLPEGFQYSSDKNSEWLNPQGLADLLRQELIEL
jgi:UDP-N-acetylglucosamine 4,6-dehydratase